MFDQDFINDGYADSHGIRVPFVCPACGRKITTRLSFPMPEVRCWELVPRKTPRAKGEPRKVRCNTLMVERKHDH